MEVVDLPYGFSEWEPIEDNPRAYLNWIKFNQSCVVSKERMVDPHHLRSRGAGGGERNNIVPLRRKYHVELHSIGVKTFAEKYGLDLEAEAIRATDEYNKGHEE